MKNVLKLAMLGVLLFAICLSGCTRRLLDFTIVSSQNVDLRIDEADRGERTRGIDRVWWFFLIPLGTANLNEAVDNAIENAGPDYDALIDGAIYFKNMWYILTGESTFIVEGTPVKTSSLYAQIEAEGRDTAKVLETVLYHSSLNKDNSKAIDKIGMVELDPEKPIEAGK